MNSRKEFLIRCRKNGVYPAHIQNSFKCLFELLEERSPFLGQLQRCVSSFKRKIINIEIKNAFHNIKVLQAELRRLNESIQVAVPDVIWNSFIDSQNKFHEHHLDNSRRSTGRKYIRLFEKSIETNTEKLPTLNCKALLNTSSVTLPPEVELLLSLGPKFSLPHAGAADAPLYHLIADAETIIKSNNDVELQERMRCKVANNIQNYVHANKNKKHSTPEERFYRETEMKTRFFLKQHPELLVLKADKGNRTVILRKEDYDAKMMQLLGDERTYEKVKRDPTSGFQTKTNDIVKRLQDLDLFDRKAAARIRTYTAVCPKIYGQPKAHKTDLPLRPVVPCMTAPTYQLSKYIGAIIQTSLNSKYNIRDSFEFCEYINNVTLPVDHIMVSFDVVALFTSIPKSLVISSIISRWNEIKVHTRICLDLFCEIVEFCIDCSYFSFNGQFYVQKFGTAMGNPLSPIVADIVTEDLLDRALTSLDFPVPHVKKYVDDLFLALPADKIDYVREKFNQLDSNIQFTVEMEKDGRLPFLDMMLVRHADQSISTEWYIKPIASGRFLNYHSHHPPHMKMNVAFNFAHRVATFSTNLEMQEIKRIIRLHLQINDYPKSLISRIINRTANRERKTAPEKQAEVTRRDTAMDEHGNEGPTKTFRSITNVVGLTQHIVKTLRKEYPEVQIATKQAKTVGSLLPLVKEKTPLQEQSNVIYSIPCGDCDACYIGMTTTKLKQRMSSHRSNIKQLQTLKQKGHTNSDPQISWIMEKTALVNHSAAMDHSFRIDSVKVVDRSLKKDNLPILESCHIKNTCNTINKRTDTDNLHAAYAGILHEIKQFKMRRKIDQNKTNQNNTNDRDDTHINTQ